jgi:hypothetical protein
VYFRQAFPSYPEASHLVKPGNRSFHHPPVDAQAAAVRREALCQQRLDAPTAQLLAVWLRVVSPVSLHRVRPAAGTTNLAPHGRDRVHQRHQLRYVVPVGAAQDGRERHALGVGDDVMLAARPGTIRGIGARFRPPKTALTDEESTTARDQSIWSAARSRHRSTSCTFCQTPCSCHAFRYRQQVMPEPQPISWGSISQGMPLLSTNRMPVRTLRRSIGRRPGYRARRGLGGGKSGSMISHSSSGTSSSAMTTPSLVLLRALSCGKADPKVKPASVTERSFC